MFHRVPRAGARNTVAARAAALTTAAAALAAASTLHAQSPATYPTRTVRFIVPFAPGGGTDVVARAIAHKLTEVWGQQVIVDNRPGGSTTIGIGMAAKSPPDGHTIVLATTSFGINAALGRKLPYDTYKDLAFVTQTAFQSYVVTVHPSLPVKSVQELIAIARRKPGALNYGSPGPASGTHLAVVLFEQMTGTEMVHIPYKGSGPALTDLIGGQIDFMFATILSVSPHLKSGRLKGLATTGAKPSKLMQDVPTVGATVKGYEATSWSGIMAPAAIPAAVRDKIHADVAKVLATPDVRSRLEADGAEPVGSTPAEFERLVRDEIAKWSKVIRSAKIQIDS